MKCKYCGKQFIQHRDHSSQNIHKFLGSCLECYYEGIVPQEDVNKALESGRFFASRSVDAYPSRF